MFRELTLEEMMFVAGGESRVYTGAGGTYHYNPNGGGGDGSGGVGGGYNTYSSSDQGGRVDPHWLFRMSGRSWCEADLAAVDQAIDMLCNGSSIANTAIGTGISNNIGINLFRYSAGGSAQDGYHTDTKVIDWDPFVLAEGTNPNGSHYVSPSVLGLAHEFVHAANPQWSESQVITATNQIAGQLNTTYGYTFDTNRGSHDGQYTMTDKIDSKEFAVRPDCPN